MDYMNTGFVTKRTANSMSLAHALGYKPIVKRDSRRKDELRLSMWKPSRAYGEYSRKLVGTCRADNLFRWLQQRHDLELVDEIQSLI